jgi:hypothetical protein
MKIRSQDSALSMFHFRVNHTFKDLEQLSGIVPGYRLDDRGFEFQQGLGIFLFTTAPRPTQPIQWVAGALSWE